MEFVTCPSCGDEVSTRYRPVNCYKCGPIAVDPASLPPDPVSSQEGVTLWSDPVQFLFAGRSGATSTGAYIGGLVVLFIAFKLAGIIGVILLIGAIFIGRAVTQRFRS